MSAHQQFPFPATAPVYDPEEDLRASVSSRVQSLWETRRKLHAVMQLRKLPNTYATWRRIKLVYNAGVDRRQYILDYGKPGEVILLP